jgi:hypothetical protein
VLCKGETLRAIALPQTPKRQLNPKSTPKEHNHREPEQEHWHGNKYPDEKFSHGGNMIAHKNPVKPDGDTDGGSPGEWQIF